MLNARRAVRTERQSTVCWRRSMVKKIFQRNGRSGIFLTGVMTVHQVSEGQAQHIGQRLQRVDVWQPDAAFPAADSFIRNVKLLSQFGLRHVPLPAHLCKECTKFFCIHSAHILFHRITQKCGKHNRRSVYLPVCRTKGRAPLREHVLFIASVSGEDQLTAGGRQRPEPCRARCPRTS